MNHQYNKNLKEYANELRTFSVSKAEKHLWKSLLKQKKLGVGFKRQRPIGNFIVDFFSQEIGLIIEIDGSSHFNKGEYDSYRDSKLKGFGFTIIRFSEGEVLNNIDEIYFKLIYTIEVLQNK
jgi:very-short-patch-repair endonuclease